MGKTEIPDNWVKSTDEMTDKEKREFVLRDNVQAGEWDYSVLDENFADFDLDDIGIELPDGFDTEPGEVTEDDYEQPEQIETDIKLGDLFSLRKDGKEIHRLLCGDATKKEDVERLMGGAKADMVFTDPPYGINYQDVKHKHDKIANDSGVEITALLSETLKQDCPLYVCCNWQSFSAFENAFLSAGKPVKSCIVWDKETRIQNLDKYAKQHEFVLYSGAFGGEHTIRGDVWRVQRQTRPDHPTAKPIELIAITIEDTTKPGGKIADYFLGSGSTMVACHQLDRKCYGMEIEPTYCQVSLDRMRKLDPDIEVVKIDG